MDVTLLSTMAAALLSLLISYVPGLSQWFDRLGQGVDDQGNPVTDDGTRKRLFVLGLLVLISAAVYGMACMDWVEGFSLADVMGLNVSCTRRGLAELVQALIFAIMANQSVYKLTPKRVWGQIRNGVQNHG